MHFAEIRYLEGYGNYVKVHLERKTILVPGTMARLEKSLPTEQFLRVHKSYIVALDRVQRVRSRAVVIGDVEIPIGRSYRRTVSELLKRVLRGPR